MLKKKMLKTGVITRDAIASKSPTQSLAWSPMRGSPTVARSPERSSPPGEVWSWGRGPVGQAGQGGNLGPSGRQNRYINHSHPTLHDSTLQKCPIRHFFVPKCEDVLQQLLASCVQRAGKGVIHLVQLH